MNLDQLTAADLMSTELVVQPATETLRTAVRAMHENAALALIVEPDRPGRGYGILTVKDVVGVLHDDDDTVLDELTIGEVATRPAVTVPTSLGIPDCIELMRMTGVRRLPVVDDDRVVGMVGYADVFGALAERVASPISGSA